MPQIMAHGQSLRRAIERWSLSAYQRGQAAIGEFASWIQPTVQVAKEYLEDDRLIWGITVDGEVNPPGGVTRFPACACFSGSREVHFRKIDCFYRNTSNVCALGFYVNVLSPPTTYNPVLFGEPTPPGTPGQYFPFVWMARGAVDYVAPRCAFVGGYQTGLMNVVVGGVPVNPALGPQYPVNVQVLGGIAFMAANTPLLDWDDPPLILPPDRILCVQVVNPNPGGASANDNYILTTQFWFSERSTS